MPKHLTAYRARVVAADTGQQPEALRALAELLPGPSLATSDGYIVTIECDVHAASLKAAPAAVLDAVAAAAGVARCEVEPDHVSVTRYD
jgi:hypothetical protein